MAPKQISLQELQQEGLKLCERNIFIKETTRNYWEKIIPKLPEEVLKYFIKLLKNFEKDFRVLIQKGLSQDPLGKHWQELMRFKKQQLSYLSKAISIREEEHADEALSAVLKNIE